MGKVIVVLIVLLAAVGGFGFMQLNAAKAAEAAAYDASAKPETAQTYAAWAEQLKTSNAMHYKLLDAAGPLQEHLAERKKTAEEYEKKLAAEKAAAEAAAKAAAEEEAKKKALTPEQRRAKWVEEYAVSAAGVPEGVRAAMTTLLTRAAAEQRDVPFKVEVSNSVGDPALKKALEGVDVAASCKWDARATPATVDLGGGDPGTEGVRVKLTWLDAKEPLDTEISEKGKAKKKALKQAKVRVAMDLRAPNTQPSHTEQEAALDAADFAGRAKKEQSLSDAYAAEAASLGAAACAKVSAMLGLKDP